MYNDLIILILEVLFFYTVVLGLHALRRRITLIPLLTVLGGMTAIMYWVTAANISVTVSGVSFFVSSTVFYSSFLLGVFVIYLFDGPVATRNSIIVIIAVSIVVPLISYGLKLQGELFCGTTLAQMPIPKFRVNLASIVATIIDLVFLAILWEYLYKVKSKLSLAPRVFLTFLGIMWIDVLLFGTGAFVGTDIYSGFLISTLLSRFLIALFIFPILFSYILWQNTRHKISIQSKSAREVLGDVAEIKRKLLTAEQALTEQKRVESLIRDSERRYRHLFEYAPVPLWEEDFSKVIDSLKQLQKQGISDLRQHMDDNPDLVMSLIHKVEVIDVNQAAVALHCAGSKAELLKNLDRIYDLESLEVSKAEFVALAEGENEFQSEAKTLTIHGELRNILVRLIMLDSNDKDYSSALVATTDISKSKKIARDLRRSEKRYRDLFEKSGDAILTIKDKHFIDCNEAAVHMLQYANKTELLNTHPADLSPENQPDGQNSLKKADEMMRIAIEQGTHRFEWEHKKQDGTIFPVEVLLTSILDQDGNKIIHTVWRDITRRNQAEKDRLNFEKQILQTQKLESLGVLAGGIAHDFNNILMGILGYADLALSVLNPLSPAKEFVEGISSSSKKAAELIKQMLAYSGKGKFTLKPIDLNLLIEDMIQMLTISISKNAVMKFNYATEALIMEGDPSQIRQIIMNLVINASEAIEDKSGFIAISTGTMYCDQDYIDGTGFEKNVSRSKPIPEGMYTFVEVSDTGIGMSKETIQKIFDPFFTTKFTGRGLGLSAVLGIAKGHRGMVKIYSELDKGTTFKVLFPVFNEVKEISKPVDVKILVEDKWQGSGTFLVADDEESVRTVGKYMFQKLGFKVLTAEDGREAINMFTEHVNEIVGVLLDLTMPHKDGAQVFQEIRKLNPSVKVILSSGYNEQDATQQFIGKGLAGFIQKPYVTDELQKKIKEVFEIGE